MRFTHNRLMVLERLAMLALLRNTVQIVAPLESKVFEHQA
jgi:hypothetical protein